MDLVRNAERMLQLLLRVLLDLSGSVSVDRSIGDLGVDPIPDDGVVLAREALVQRSINLLADIFVAPFCC